MESPTPDTGRLFTELYNVTVCRPVTQTKTFKVCEMVQETKSREVNYTVCRVGVNDHEIIGPESDCSPAFFCAVHLPGSVRHFLFQLAIFVFQSLIRVFHPPIDPVIPLCLVLHVRDTSCEVANFRTPPARLEDGGRVEDDQRGNDDGQNQPADVSPAVAQLPIHRLLRSTWC
jgi:hypothetical protein